ncbi:MAG: methylenetetrahydrofolate reductase [NAD(P)H] [Lentisphaerae bacterium]|nr:MAG: methylenetetrahydrofolate reductase [NAD(P)H] [Lentisphaerota bacterium]
MPIREKLGRETLFSFEFFPPKTAAGVRSLMRSIHKLETFSPSFVSVTMGAGGTDLQQKRTRDTVMRIHKETSLTIMPHLTAIGKRKEEVRSELDAFAAQGVTNIFALRGDYPAGDNGQAIRERTELHYANELVAFIREHYGDHFSIGVAGYPEGHPETPSKLQDLYNLKRKIDAGAEFIITQLFFDNREFFDFRDRCQLIGIDVPIIAGIMPILSRQGILRMCDLCGARIPASLLRQIFDASDDDVAQIGIEWAYRQCEELLREEVAGLHFYTLNKSKATCKIFTRLRQNKACSCNGECE